MNSISQQLYEEFLDNYQLNKSLYNHSVELIDHKFYQDVLRKYQFKNFYVIATESSKNTQIFRTQLKLSEIEAERIVKKIISGYRSYRMETDDLVRLCDFLEQELLQKLLWPFHLFTVGIKLDRNQFNPIAHEMEQMLWKVFDIFDNFYNAFIQSEASIRQNAKEEIIRRDRQTDAWAANAPQRIRGSIREYGDRLYLYANVESTVTQGQIAADYQVNELIANRNAKRQSLENQKGLLDYLENSLLKIVENYIPMWHKCLENEYPPVIGDNFMRTAVYKDLANYEPYIKDNAIAIFKHFTDEDNVATICDMYSSCNHDFDELFGKKVAVNMYNEYVRTKNITCSNLMYRTYCYFYDVENAVEYEPFFKRFLEIIKERAKHHCEKYYNKDKEKYASDSTEIVLRPFYNIFDCVPGLTDNQEWKLIDACKYIYYDILGDIDSRDIYDEEKGVPRFIF